MRSVELQFREINRNVLTSFRRSLELLSSLQFYFFGYSMADMVRRDHILGFAICVPTAYREFRSGSIVPVWCVVAGVVLSGKAGRIFALGHESEKEVERSFALYCANASLITSRKWPTQRGKIEFCLQAGQPAWCVWLAVHE